MIGETLGGEMLAEGEFVCGVGFGGLVVRLLEPLSDSPQRSYWEDLGDPTGKSPDFSVGTQERLK